MASVHLDRFVWLAGVPGYVTVFTSGVPHLPYLYSAGAVILLWVVGYRCVSLCT